ncbi:MAG: 50S ribosomal protein L21 [Desulfurella sp.]
MFAVIETGSKQYIVKEGDILKVEKLNASKGDEIEFDKVLMVDGKVGNPYVENAKVKATVITQGKAKKIIVFKFKRRKGFKKKIGHRQHFTQVKITQILA